MLSERLEEISLKKQMETDDEEDIRLLKICLNKVSSGHACKRKKDGKRTKDKGGNEIEID